MEINGIELAFLCVVSIQIVYWLVWLSGVARLRSSTAVKEGDGVSVVIAANNELENLRQTLPVILEQHYSNYEVIVVDDRSSDASYEYLLGLANQYKNLQVLSVSELPDHLNGKKYALTLGIKTARHDQILLTDADCRPVSKNWLGSFAHSWGEKTSFLLGFSQYGAMPGLLNYFIRFETALTGIQYMAAAVLGRPYMGVGRNLSYSKTLFLSKKGFHGYQNLTGGDDDLFVNKYAIGANTGLVVGQETTTISFPKTSWKAYLNQKTRHLSVGKHYSFKSKIALFFFSLTWVLTWFLFPFFMISANHFFLPISFFALRLLLLGTTFVVFSKRTGTKLGILGLILLDFMFTLYYFVAGFKTMFTRRVKWR